MPSFGGHRITGTQTIELCDDAPCLPPKRGGGVVDFVLLSHPGVLLHHEVGHGLRGGAIRLREGDEGEVVYVGFDVTGCQVALDDSRSVILPQQKI